MSISDIKIGMVVRLTDFEMKAYNIIHKDDEMIGAISYALNPAGYALNPAEKPVYMVRCIMSTDEKRWIRGKAYVLYCWKNIEILKGDEAKRWLLLDKI